MTITVMPLSEKAWDAEGLSVTRSRESQHVLSTQEGFNWNDNSVSDEKVVKVLKAVCRECPALSQCLPEYIIPTGLFNTDSVKIRGAQVHSDNCNLVDTFIPDKEFRS